MDIVIPYIKSSTDELRYCLRSLKNIPHRNVFICGDKPDYISDKVIYLPRKSRGVSAQHDCELNIRLALEDDRLSDEFIYMNDDFYIIKHIAGLPTYQNGTIRQLIGSRPERPFMKYNNSLRETVKYLNNFDNPISFELHIPMVMNKNDRLEISNDILPILSKGKTVLPRSIYGNSFCDINEYRQDVKLYTENEQPTDKVFLSTIERSFNGIAGSLLKEKFKEKCEYESWCCIYSKT